MRGNIGEIGVLPLLKALRNSKGTGELILISEEQFARVYLKDGLPIYAESDEAEGAEVLQAIREWECGEFEFRKEVEPPGPVNLGNEIWPEPEDLAEPMFDLDDTLLPTTISVLTTQGGPIETALADPVVRDKLNRFLESTPSCLEAYVCNAQGFIVAESEAKTVPARLSAGIKAMVANLCHNQLTVKRVLVEDDDAKVFLQRLPSGSLLVVMADPSVLMGVLTRAAGKLADSLD